MDIAVLVASQVIPVLAESVDIRVSLVTQESVATREFRAIRGSVGSAVIQESVESLDIVESLVSQAIQEYLDIRELVVSPDIAVSVARAVTQAYQESVVTRERRE